MKEAVLTCTHNLRFEQNEEKNQHFSSENYLFFIAVKNCSIAVNYIGVFLLCNN